MAHNKRGPLLSFIPELRRYLGRINGLLIVVARNLFGADEALCTAALEERNVCMSATHILY